VTTLATTLRNARADQITSAVGNAGLLRIYTAGYASLLSENVMGTPMAPAAAAGVLTLNAISSATASATGTAAIARLLTSAGVMKVEGLTVGTSGTDVILDTTSIVSGDTVSITSATITEGNP
jgi:hypothetical protein